jgi:putative intracellular protease/amidase
MCKGKVLVVGSNATRIEIQGGATGPTGQYLNETVVPVMALVEEGYEIVLATPDGGKPHIDPVSDVAQHFDGDEAAHRRGRVFFDDDPAMNDVRTLRSVINVGLDGYPVDFSPHFVEDRELITGQNPRSDHPLAAKLVEALNRAAVSV